MRTVELAEVGVHGAQALRPQPEGVVLSRLPERYRHQVADPGLAFMADTAAGVRLALHTDARVLELDVLLTLMQVTGAPPATVSCELLVDGAPVQTCTAQQGQVVEVAPLSGDVRFHGGEAVTWRFDRLPGDVRARLEVWLPHDAVVAVRQVRVDDGARVRPAARDRPRWAHYGSSISHCFEAPGPTRTWPALVARAAGLDLDSLAVAGQCLLDPHVARTLRDLPASLVSAEVGINVVNLDAVRERVFVPLLHGFLDTVRDGHPTTPVVLVSPVLFPAAEDVPGPTRLGVHGGYEAVPRPPELAEGALSVRRVRRLVRDVVEVRRAAGDPHLHLVDGLDLLGPDDVELLADGLHPGPDGYALMAERFHARVAPLLPDA